MIELFSPPPGVRALLLVAAVFVEAVILYVSYGIVERTVGSALIDRVERV